MFSIIPSLNMFYCVHYLCNYSMDLPVSLGPLVLYIYHGENYQISLHHSLRGKKIYLISYYLFMISRVGGLHVQATITPFVF